MPLSDLVSDLLSTTQPTQPPNTMPDKTLRAFADRGELKGVLAVDGGGAEGVLAEFTRIGVDDSALAALLPREGAESFAQSWQNLMGRIVAKSTLLKKGDQTRAGQP